MNKGDKMLHLQTMSLLRMGYDVIDPDQTEYFRFPG
jgi:hypothetical protein